MDTQNINRVFKEDIQRQKQEQKVRSKLQKNLEISIKQQDKLEKERARQDAKLKKMSEQQTLSDRLLSNEREEFAFAQKIYPGFGPG